MCAFFSVFPSRLANILKSMATLRPAGALTTRLRAYDHGLRLTTLQNRKRERRLFSGDISLWLNSRCYRDPLCGAAEMKQIYRCFAVLTIRCWELVSPHSACYIHVSIDFTEVTKSKRKSVLRKLAAPAWWWFGTSRCYTEPSTRNFLCDCITKSGRRKNPRTVLRTSRASEQNRTVRFTLESHWSLQYGSFNGRR